MTTDSGEGGSAGGGDRGEWVFDGQGRLFDLSQAPEVATHGPPPVPRWVAPIDLPGVFGRRCALVNRTGTTYDLRCVSEVFESNGGLFVNVVDEDQWYRWLDVPAASRPAQVPRATCIGARHLWVEVHDETRPTPDPTP